RLDRARPLCCGGNGSVSGHSLSHADRRSVLGRVFLSRTLAFNTGSQAAPSKRGRAAGDGGAGAAGGFPIPGINWRDAGVFQAPRPRPGRAAAHARLLQLGFDLVAAVIKALRDSVLHDGAGVLAHSKIRSAGPAIFSDRPAAYRHRQHSSVIPAARENALGPASTDTAKA